MFDASCPNCDQSLEIPQSYVGQEVKCPHCAHDFTAAPIVAGSAPAVRLPSKKSSSAPKRRKTSSASSDEVPAHLEVQKGRLILCSAYEIVGYLSLLLAVISLICIVIGWMDDDSPGSLGSFASGFVFLLFFINALIFLGIAQLINLFHSIAYNIQSMSKGQ